MPRPTTIARLAASCALAALLAGGIGCGGEEERSPTRGAGEGREREPDQVYTVRGAIRQLPDPENPAAGLQIQHENIPDFADKTGAVVGMKPMIMPFTPAPELDLSGLSLGDKVSFTFDVDWDGSPMIVVTEIEPLPAETELDFTAPDEPVGPEGEGETPGDG